MPKAKPVSLFPLSFEQAIDMLVNGVSQKPKKKRAKSKPEKRKKSK